MARAREANMRDVLSASVLRFAQIFGFAVARP
jgi:hypothetical protein